MRVCIRGHQHAIIIRETQRRSRVHNAQPTTGHDGKDVLACLTCGFCGRVTTSKHLFRCCTSTSPLRAAAGAFAFARATTAAWWCFERASPVANAVASSFLLSSFLFFSTSLLLSSSRLLLSPVSSSLASASGSGSARKMVEREVNLFQESLSFAMLGSSAHTPGRPSTRGQVVHTRVCNDDHCSCSLSPNAG